MLNTLFANDMRQTLDHFRRSVDSLFDTFYGAPAENRTSGEWTFSPAIESGWADGKLVLRAIVPGVNEKDLKVSVQNNQLVIEGERKAPEGWSGNYRQLVYGRFYASVALPSGLDLEKVSCRLHDGVLDVAIPAGEQMKPRQVRIETGERKAISA